MHFFLPRDDAFFVLFERLAATAVDASETLQEYFAGEITSDRFQALDDIEHQGDAITQEVIERLSHSFITPVDRDDIHRLIHALDDVIDAVEGAAEMALLCAVQQATPDALKMSRLLVEVSSEVATLVSGLHRRAHDLQPHVIRVHELENQGDHLWLSAFATLRDGHLAPLDVITWKEIYQQIENAVNAGERAALIVEEIVYKLA